MEKIYAFVRQHLLAISIGVGVLCLYGFLTWSGRECFNCKQTETYKSDSPSGTALRFRHK